MKFAKKPVVIDAFQMTEERRYDNSEWPEWLHEAWNKSGEGSLYCVDGGNPLFIGTKEGVMSVTFGDWIIQGIQGELYLIKNEIFLMTYELVT